MTDVCKVVIDYEEAKTEKKKKQVDTGEFELIFKANQQVEKPINSFGLNLEIVGNQIKQKNLNKW